MSDRPALDFEAVWDVASTIPGWLTEEQAKLLFDTARDLSSASAPLLLEIGSHQGKSTVVLASAARAQGGKVVAVDPFVDGRLFGGASTRTKFEDNLREADLTDAVELLPEYSTRARPTWTRDIDYLYIDGKHDYWTLADDLKWAEHLPPGAPILVHDCYSSIGVTLGVLAHVLPSTHIRYERRAGSMALFRVGKPSWEDRRRILREVPWWLRNVVVKVLLRLRLRPVASRLFGHEGPYDPY
jgi:hypothetical protein